MRSNSWGEAKNLPYMKKLEKQSEHDQTNTIKCKVEANNDRISLRLSYKAAMSDSQHKGKT